MPRKNHLHVVVQRHLMRKSKHENVCLANSTLVAAHAKKFSLGHWSFLGPGPETKWNATDTCKPGGEWDRVAVV